jgi:hypothetical protein
MDDGWTPTTGAPAPQPSRHMWTCGRIPWRSSSSVFKALKGPSFSPVSRRRFRKSRGSLGRERCCGWDWEAIRIRRCAWSARNARALGLVAAVAAAASILSSERGSN